jgi:hypothetical protein
MSFYEKQKGIGNFEKERSVSETKENRRNEMENEKVK